MSYEDHVRANRRLTILRTLAEAKGYSANEGLLHRLVEDFGFVESRDTIRADLAWLGEQELIHLSEPGGLMIAELSARGSDVASGRATHPGIAKPSPKR